jgi:hypothetical protein
VVPVQRKPRKLWATKPVFAGSTPCRHESKAATYRYIKNYYLRNWLAGALRFQRLTVLVDERDGQGWQLYERIDLDELAKAGEAS